MRTLTINITKVTVIRKEHEDTIWIQFQGPSSPIFPGALPDLKLPPLPRGTATQWLKEHFNITPDVDYDTLPTWQDLKSKLGAK